MSCPRRGWLGGLLAITLALAGCAHRAESEPLWVGHVAPLSGADKVRGEQAKQGIALAVDEANAAENRILGQRVAVAHADTRSDSAAVRSVVKRLLTINRVVALLGGPETAHMEGLGSTAQSSNVPFVLSGSPPAAPASEYIFYTGLSSTARGRALGRFTRDTLKKHRIAVVGDGRQNAAVEAFTREVSKTAVAGAWTYDHADKLKVLADEVATAKPDALLFAGPVSDFTAWMRVAPNLRIPILFTGEDEDGAALTSASTVYRAAAFAVDESVPAIKEFAGHYQERFNAAPTAAAASAYDDARLIFAALRQAQSTDGGKVSKELSQIRFESLTGPLTFNKDHVAVRTIFIVKLEQGKTEVAQRYPPEEQQSALPASSSALAVRAAAR